MDANEHKYYYFNLCLFVFIRGFPYPWSPLAPPIRRIPDSCGKAGKPLSSFLFPISGLNVLVAGTGNPNLKELRSL